MDDVTPLAIGFCATCALPLTEEAALNTEIEGELHLFCTDRCTRGYQKIYRLPLPHW